MDPPDHPAQRVLDTLGFHREGVHRDYGYWKRRYWDETCYSLLAAEWPT